MIEPIHVKTPSDLCGRWVSEKYFLLTNDLKYELTYNENYVRKVRTLVIPMGFSTDLASVPRVFWRIVPRDGLSTLPAILHDYLYSCGGLTEIDSDFSRKDADQFFKLALETEGAGRIKRSLMYRAVRMFGGSGWGKETIILGCYD